MSRLITFTTAVAFSCSLTCHAAELKFHLHELSPRVSEPPPQFAATEGLNNLGQVALSGFFPPNEYHSWIWQSGSLTDVTRQISADAVFVEVRALNDRQQMVGSLTTGGNLQGFFYTGSETIDISFRPGDPAVYVYGLNNRRQLIGESWDDNGDSHPFWWNDGIAMALSPLPGDGYASAIALNDQGVLAGNSYGAVTKAVMWIGGAVMALPVPRNVTSSRAADINERGEIALTATVNSRSRAAVWEDGHLHYLPPLHRSQTDGSVASLNDCGDVTGQTNYLDEGLQMYFQTPTLWIRGRAFDLADAIADDDPARPYVTITSAGAINNRGEIIVGGRDSREPNLSHTYLLTPTRTWRCHSAPSG